MPATYEPIASQTVSNGTTASLTFSGIPGTFTDLVLVVTGGVVVGGADDQMTLRFNSDTGSNYSNTTLDDGPGSGRASNTTSIYIHRCDAGALNILFANIQSYANTNVNKTVLASATAPNRANLKVQRGVGLWRSTSAITSVTIREHSGTFLFNGLRASLYGIKAA